MNEFDIIKKFFAPHAAPRKDVIAGIGDDCAIVNPDPNQQIAITTDTLVAGVHFFENADAYDIGFKSLAVNLSDLAAMGATPAWVTMALTLPTADENWLNHFAQGFFALANRYQVQLIGGDLTRGPLSITIQAMGLVPNNQFLRRSGAKVDDLIYVTHTLGDAALALHVLQNKLTLSPLHQKEILQRLNRPEPRITIGKSLRNISNAAIDISDGLAADLTHILTASQVGAVINVDHIPLSDTLHTSMPHAQAIALALNGGDDYELCFTVPNDQQASVPSECTCIGKIVATPGLTLQFDDGTKYALPVDGYQHF